MCMILQATQKLSRDLTPRLNASEGKERLQTTNCTSDVVAHDQETHARDSHPALAMHVPRLLVELRS